MLISPLEQRIVISAHVVGAPTGASFSFALEVGVGCAHDGLAEVIEAVGRVVSDFVGQVCALVAALVVVHDVRQAVQLVEDGHHVGRSIGIPVQRHYIRIGQDVVGSVVGDLDVPSSVYRGENNGLVPTLDVYL
ncbi:hypothetical protein RRF57_011660 [Xylaria bambusicola]|uniref:Uncharacterized protein n=1 Tax=Xylaria bambusicola TaxID=326684 RepID=A0AAN7ZE80_9PEZI